MNQRDVILLLKENLDNLTEAKQWLQRSSQQCKKIGVKENYLPEEHDAYENLTSRFARTSDILIQKVFRSIDQVELEEKGSLIDALNRAHKRELIESIDQIRLIRDLRNSIAHEYVTPSLKSLYQETVDQTPILFRIIERTETYCKKYL